MDLNGPEWAWMNLEWLVWTWLYFYELEELVYTWIYLDKLKNGFELISMDFNGLGSI